MKFLMILLLLFPFGCKNDQDPSNGDLAAKDHILVLASEFEELTEEGRRCNAKLLAKERDIESLELAAFAKGEAACQTDKKEYEKEVQAKLLSEIKVVMDEVKEKLLQYRLANAVVNGKCKAQMNNGDLIYYTLTNACLNVVNKKVGNDGEVSGLLGAVSHEAVKEGIVSLDCIVGQANIKLISKKCSEYTGSGAGAGKIEINSH